MYSYSELNAVEFSPTKKDFYAIWNELLEVAGKLSARWDPTATNEADPGIVLLKVLTAIADKLNYAIDANTLEAFMPSAAQESSMRKLCEMLGYSMRYYQSATTTAKISYLGKEFPQVNEVSMPIMIDRFTNLKDIDGTINYVTLKATSLQEASPTTIVPCIEGELVVCESDIGQAITLKNLDDAKRYFLPEAQVAHNGIFISNIINGYNTLSVIDWEQTDNLNIHEYGSKVYKFGFDSSVGLPYVQFPEDIGSLIGDGLSISFIRTRGLSGNIAVSTLNKMEKPISWSVTEESGEWTDVSKYAVTNISAAKNGANPETIDEAYWNYQKTIGTFDTLVSCRDYMNKIYNLTVSETNSTPLVSNIIVSDIRDDINRASTICTMTTEGLEYKHLTRRALDETTGNYADCIEHFDLVLYPFKTILGLNTKEEFADSFTYNDRNLHEIKNALSEFKTVSHNFLEPAADDIVCIKIYLLLNAKISTTYKVSLLEANDIEKTVYSALYSKFNARYINFGEELPYDLILREIEKADPRIKSVSLDEPKVKIVAREKGGKEHIIVSEVDDPITVEAAKIYNKLVANNIIAGRIPLFNYDREFNTSYAEASADGYTALYCSRDDESTSVVKMSNIDQEDLLSYSENPWSAETIQPAQSGAGGEIESHLPEIDQIVGEFLIDPVNVSLSTPLKLTKNEVVQFRLPSLATKVTYPAYVNYYANLPEVNQRTAPAAPATMQTLLEFFNGGPAVTSFVDSNKQYWAAYSALWDGAALGDGDSWDPIVSWEEKINHISNDESAKDLIKRVLDTRSVGFNSEASLSSKITELEDKHKMLFVKDGDNYFSVLRQKYIQVDGVVRRVTSTEISEKTVQLENIKHYAFKNKGDVVNPDWKLCDPGPSTTETSDDMEYELYALDITSQNFSTFLKWIKTASCHRIDSLDCDLSTASLIASSEASLPRPHKILVSDGSRFNPSATIETSGAAVEYINNGTTITLVSGLYKLLGNNESYLPGWLIDNNHNKFSILYGWDKTVGDRIFDRCFVPRLWRKLCTDNSLGHIMHSQSGVGRDVIPAYIPKNSEYQLKQGEYILINYSSSANQASGNTVPVNIYLGKDDIIRPNFDLADTGAVAAKTGYSKTTGYGPWQLSTGATMNSSQIRGMLTLGVNEQIELRKIVQIKLDKPNTNVYWELRNEKILADTNNIVNFPTDDNGCYILQSGEYFYYTDANKQDLAYYGAGTEIKLAGVSLSKQLDTTQTNAEQINKYGLDAVIPWQPLQLDTDTKNIYITEYQYINLTEGDQLLEVKLDDTEPTSRIDSTFKKVAANATVRYEVSGTVGILPKVDIEGMAWEVGSRLDISLSETAPQVLHVHKLDENKLAARDLLTIYAEQAEIQTYTPQGPNYKDLAVYASKPIISLSGDAVLQTVDELARLGASNISPYKFKCVNKTDLLAYGTAFNEGTSSEGYSSLVFKNRAADDFDLELNTIIPEDRFGLIAFYNRKEDTDSSCVQLLPVAESGNHQIEATFILKYEVSGTPTTLIWKKYYASGSNIELPTSANIGQTVDDRAWPGDINLLGWNISDNKNSIEASEFTFNKPVTFYALITTEDDIEQTSQKLTIPDTICNKFGELTSLENDELPEGLTIIELQNVKKLRIKATDNIGGQLLFSPLYLVDKLNPLNPKLGCYTDAEIKHEIDDPVFDAYAEILALLKSWDTTNTFLYCGSPIAQEGLDLNDYDPLDTLRLAKHWYDPENINNKFVVAEIDSDYLERNQHVSVSKFSRY